MPELTALETYECPACGAQAEWNPGRQLLECPYCGTKSAFEVDPVSGEIQEIDLVQTLRELPEELRSWKATKKTVRCQSCRAVTVFDPERVGQRCDFCGSPALVDYEELKPPIRPQSLLPFQVSESQVRDRFRTWLKGRWLAPGNLKKRALVDTLHGLYIPYWTFDARVDCPWEADAGHYYYVTVEYRDAQGKRRTKRERRVRWEHAAGEIRHQFDDELIPGTQGIDRDLLTQVEPFPTRDLVPYDPAYLSGFAVEHYQVVLIDAAKQARGAMDAKLRALCAQEIPGDTYRNLQIFPDYSGETFKHVLVPVWLVAYDYGRKSYQLVANGVTGEIAGRYPKSAWKIFFLVLAVLVVVAFFLYAGCG